MNQTVQRLDNDNRSLSKAKEDLETKLTNKNTDIRNVQYDLKHHRDDVNKREILLQENITKNENELQKEREMFKNLNNHHVALKKQLENLLREKDDNEVILRNLRDREYALAERLKAVSDELNRSEGTQIKVELKNHVEGRRKHLDEVRGLLDNLSKHLGKVNAQEEYKGNENDFNYYQNRVEDLDGEIKNKDVRLNELNNENYALRIESDCNKKHRADYEVSHRNYLDLKEQHDKLHSENNRLKSENQNLERDIRDRRAEAHEIRESMQQGEYDRFGSAERFGSGRKD